ncbi:hypothetical protein M422DRAFT_175722 [Sphaerobolus stellatus SS14]|uniref:FAD-binding PCMH-type domain-containing protein n=1 Tax=Sphaerobolus stellatus (strain SS14) TaxID=990650 RepID=A0A0C9VBV2_SPHS4|nr:hypothetical protein M422DRAFT_175722 [Sphaerobolus stellatus SS14]
MTWVNKLFVRVFKLLILISVLSELAKPSMEALGIKGQILTPESGEDYINATQRNSEVAVKKPKYIVFPDTPEGIPLVIAFARSQSLEIAVKCGGVHAAPWATSEGGIVIDLGHLNKVVVSPDKKSVTVQGGALWGDVYEVCKEANIEVVGGALWYVGVGGFMVGGGYSPLSGEHGLAVDNVLSAKVVLADGRIVKTSPTEEPDLFWAIKGGGNQFGIVIEFILKAYPPLGPYTTGSILYSGKEITKVLKAIQQNHTGKERLNIIFLRTPPDFSPKVMILPWIADGVDAEKSLAKFTQGDVKPLSQKIGTAPDIVTTSHSADAQRKFGPKRLTIRGTLFSDFYDELFLGIWDRWCNFTEKSPDVRGSVMFWDLTKPDKITQIGESDTAMHVRSPHYCDPASDALCDEFTSDVVSFARETNTKISGKDLGYWISLSQGDEKPEEIFGDNLPRLEAIKVKYDPKGVWNKGIVIKPQSA